MLFEDPTLISAWRTHITEGLKQSPRWWLKPQAVKADDLKFGPSPLYTGLEIFSPQSKIIKQLNTKLVSAWLALMNTHVFVHRFDTVAGATIQITCMGKNLFFSGIQDRTTFNLLPVTIKDYADWGVRVCNNALDGITLENYRLDSVLISPTMADLRAKNLLNGVATALFTLQRKKSTQTEDIRMLMKEKKAVNDVLAF